MKKIISILLSTLFIFLTGCSIGSTKEKEKIVFIPLDSPNFLTLDYNKLSKKIISGIPEFSGVNGDCIDKDYSLDIFFKPNGEIISFNGALKVDNFRSEVEHTSTLYFLDSRYTKTDNNNKCNFIGIEMNEETKLGEEIDADKDLLKDPDPTQNPNINNTKYNDSQYKSYPNFIKWINDFNSKKLLKEQIKDKPVFYEFVTNDYLLRNDIIKDDSINVTFLDYSSGKATKLNDKDTRSKIKAGKYLNFNDRQFFCAILPYYLQDGTIKGYEKNTLGPYILERKNASDYIAKNIIVIFNDNILE